MCLLLFYCVVKGYWGKKPDNIWLERFFPHEFHDKFAFAEVI